MLWIPYSHYWDFALTIYIGEIVYIHCHISVKTINATRNELCWKKTCDFFLVGGGGLFRVREKAVFMIFLLRTFVCIAVICGIVVLSFSVYFQTLCDLGKILIVSLYLSKLRLSLRLWQLTNFECNSIFYYRPWVLYLIFFSFSKVK